MKIAAKLFLIALIISVIPTLVHGQSCVDGQDPGCNPDVACPCPIDSAVLFLVAVVIAVAAKRAFDLRKKAGVNV